MIPGHFFCPKVCPNRTATCHSTCERYKTRIEEYQKKKAAIEEAKKKQSAWTAAGERAARKSILEGFRKDRYIGE